MKKLILFSCLLVPLLMHGQCYITDGMMLRTRIFGGILSEGEELVSTEIVSIEQTEDEGWRVL